MRSSAMCVAAAALLALSAAGCSGSPPETAAAVAPTHAPVTVRVDAGLLRGESAATVRHFLGVPYARPPVGGLRWAPPHPAAHWPGVREAVRPGNRCPQTEGGPGQPASTDEDCLFANVTTPREVAPGAKLPVMVWWHGGGYTSGAGSDYNADRLAAQGNVIVVTLNSRLGVFGYFGLPGLPGSGNFGLADQLAGTRWAKDNARAFGGDPDNITVFGESSGGMSVCAALTSPRAPGLVDRASIASGSCLLDWPTGGLYPGAPRQTPYVPLRQDQEDGLAAARSAGCPSGELSCMRKKPAADLLPLNEDFADHLTYGTPLLPLNPATALREGRFLRVPVISGGNRDEARAYVGGAMLAGVPPITAKTYPAMLRTTFGDDAGRVAARYPLSRYASPPLAWSTVISDASWACETAASDRQLAAHTTVYPYEFADPDAPDVNRMNIPGLPMGATHATDLPSLFDLGGKYLLKTKAQQAMGATMVMYWTTFARTGSPNHAGAPKWDAGTVRGTGQLQFVPGRIRETDVAAEHQCPFWATVR
ncbi:carboxylesterase/lipase family protein [Streptomyces sp. NBC_01438]|uniref:carboxylesterase/lipase family protein n=1 Tax=Streptomyces sp. NBC_01438 TaxID=2903866 RepID=UPI00324EFD99